MLTEQQESEIRGVINICLHQAEQIWKETGPYLQELAAKFSDEMAAAISTLIPGHEKIDPGKPEVGEFVALVLDVRDSTKHLRELYDGGHIPQHLQRVLYETFALLPAVSKAVDYEKGRTTEYLGDGLLAIFNAPEARSSERDNALYKAYWAAEKCFDVRQLVNSILHERYSLPALDIGIGLAWSKAVVLAIGLPDNLHPKVLGECVYYATKLCKGRNEIYTDKRTHLIWPTAEGGPLRFSERNMRGITGYLINRKT